MEVFAEITKLEILQGITLFAAGLLIGPWVLAIRRGGLGRRQR
jgi:hypothetical protein